MWWIWGVPQYFILQLVFQYIFHEGAPKKSHAPEDGSERTFRRSLLMVFKEFRILWPLLDCFCSRVKPTVSLDNSALRVTSHYSLDSHVPWMTGGLHTVSPLRRWLAPLSQMAAAGDGNSGAVAVFFGVARLKRADLLLAALCGSGIKGGTVVWGLTNHDNVLGRHFKRRGRGPAGSAHFLFSWSLNANVIGQSWASVRQPWSN